MLARLLNPETSQQDQVVQQNPTTPIRNTSGATDLGESSRTPTLVLPSRPFSFSPSRPEDFNLRTPNRIRSKSISPSLTYAPKRPFRALVREDDLELEDQLEIERLITRVDKMSLGNNQNRTGLDGDEENPPVQRQTWMQLSDAAKRELKGELLKKKIPIFDAETMARDVLQWLEDVESFCAVNGIVSGEAKISVAMSQMTYRTRKYLGSVIEAAKGYSWDEFKKQLLKEFPEAKESELGSKESLLAICEKWRAIPLGASQKLKSFHREFNYEVVKLLKEPAVISNLEAVTLYLGVLDSVFQEELRRLLATKIMQKLEANPEDDTIKSRGDPWKLADVQATAIALCATVSSQSYLPSKGQFVLGSNPTISSSIMPLRGQEVKAESSGLQLSSWERQRGLVHGVGLQSNTGDWEAKVCRDLDQHGVDISELKIKQDTEFKAIHNKLEKNTSTVDSMSKQISELVRRNGQSPGGNMFKGSMTVDSANKGSLTSDLVCFCCGKSGHGVKDCPGQQKLLKNGIVRFNENTRYWELRDGNRLPMWKPGDAGPTRLEKIIEIAKEKGWVGAGDQYLVIEVDPYDTYNLSEGPPDTEQLQNRIEALEMELRKRDSSKN